jgi:hypothetical protein
MRRKAAREESPGSMDKRCRITSGEFVAAKAADGFIVKFYVFHLELR